MKSIIPFLMTVLFLVTSCKSEVDKLQKQEDELMNASMAEGETAANFHEMSLKIKDSVGDQDSSWRAYEDSSQVHLQNSGRIAVKITAIQKKIEELKQ
ncbi:MAG: hypothetical protein ACXVBJ_08110 [Flavisolibacter sp.]